MSATLGHLLAMILILSTLVGCGAQLKPYELNDMSEASDSVNYIQDRCIYITNFHFNADGNDNYNLNDEYVAFRNKCSYSISMDSWTVKDETTSHMYTISSFTFQAGATFTLNTGTGTNTNSVIYWGRTSGDYQAIWNNDGDTLFLRDSDGNLVLSQSYSGY